MLLSYQYRLYPTETQAQLLDRILSIHRRLYNQALEERKNTYEQLGKTVNYLHQANQIKQTRQNDPDAAWLNYTSVQQTLRRLQKAFDAFFRRVKAGEKPGYPRFKSKRFFTSVCYVYEDGVRLKDGRLYVQNVGRIRLFQHRPLPEGQIKMGVLKQDKVGCWYANFQVDTNEPVENPASGKPAVGIDMGLETFAALSNGELIDNPRWFRETEQKLAELQKRQSRCSQGSKQYQDLGRKISRLHRDIAQKRNDFHHKLSARLVAEYGFIAVEDLNVKGLAASHVSKSMGDAGWSQFIQMLEYKASQAGVEFVKVNPHDTSQLCSQCGQRVQKSLAERVHHCPECGFVANRDVNAALNIQRLGLSLAVKCAVAAL